VQEVLTIDTEMCLREFGFQLFQRLRNNVCFVFASTDVGLALMDVRQKHILISHRNDEFSFVQEKGLRGPFSMVQIDEALQLLREISVVTSFHEHTLKSIQGFIEAFWVDGFEQVVDAIAFECGQHVFVMCCAEHNWTSWFGDQKDVETQAIAQADVAQYQIYLRVIFEIVHPLLDA
jgi:hypothetical protein